MDVFLVPVGREAYELYCEHVDEPEAHEAEYEARAYALPDGFGARVKYFLTFKFVGRLKLRFHQMLADAERERRQEVAVADQGGWMRRATRRVMRWVAESIAEQRLLWNLRKHETATLNHPHDMTADAAGTVMRQQLARDFDKHRFWLAIDAILLVLSGLLILVPGPNVIGYYFAFRVVGHYFSVRGARKGLDHVQWTPAASEPLTELRRALTLDAPGRLREAEAVASRLRLDHLATFFQRTAVSS
jgi:hypothetical protein